MGINQITDESDPGPFNSTIRSLLVDHILSYLNFDKNDLKLIYMNNIAEIMNAGVSKKDKKRNDALKRNMKNESSLVKKLINSSGLPFMLNEGYFEDAFILHDESNFPFHINEMRRHIKSTEMADKGVLAIDTCRNLNSDLVSLRSDSRLELHNKWAKFKNVFKLQPFQQIKNYFGEKVAFYFAWIGTFINTLWIPTFIGIGFFFGGLGIRY